MSGDVCRKPPNVVMTWDDTRNGSVDICRTLATFVDLVCPKSAQARRQASLIEQSLVVLRR